MADENSCRTTHASHHDERDETSDTVLNTMITDHLTLEDSTPTPSPSSFLPGNSKTVLELCQNAAVTGNSDAAFALAISYLDGRPCTKEPELMKKWMLQAATDGHAEAQFRLGCMYKDGEAGFDVNDKKALDCLGRAAQQGHTDAQRLLGTAYYQGEMGVDVDIEKAVEYWTCSASGGNSLAMHLVGNLYYRGEGGLPQNYEKAVELFEKSLGGRNDHQAKYLLYFCYRDGKGVEQNVERAMELLTESAKAENVGALYDLGWRYKEGKDVEKDIFSARQCLSVAANHGHLEARKLLGEIQRQELSPNLGPNTLKHFRRIWLLHIDDPEKSGLNDIFDAEVSNFDWTRKGFTDVFEIMLKSIVRYGPLKKPLSEKVILAKEALFCLSAFKHGFGNVGFFRAFVNLARGILASLKVFSWNADQLDSSQLVLVWLKYCSWIYIGFVASEIASDQHTDAAWKFSRPLAIDEFRLSKPYDDVLEKKGTEKTAVFVSHRWQKKHHPDPGNTEKPEVERCLMRTQEILNCLSRRDFVSLFPQARDPDRDVDYLHRLFRGIAGSHEWYFAMHFFAHGQRDVLVWYDFYSIPQGGTEMHASVRKQCLGEINECCRTMPVLVLPSADYLERGWCLFECIQASMSAKMIDFRILNESTDDAMVSSVAMMKSLLPLRVQNVHSRFCRLMEQNLRTEDMFKMLGIKCSNGDDPSILATLLEKSSRTYAGIEKYRIPSNLKDPTLKVYGGIPVLHPFRSAFTVFVGSLLNATANDITLLAPKMGFLLPLMIAFDAALAETSLTGKMASAFVKCKYAHQGGALSGLANSRRDWGYILPGFDHEVNQILALLESIDRLCTGCPVGSDARSYAGAESENVFARLGDILKTGVPRTVGVVFPPYPDGLAQYFPDLIPSEATS